MAKSKFPAEDLALAIRVAREMAEGPYIADFEFLALMHYDRETYLSLVCQLETGASPTGKLASVIGSALLNATEFPHKDDARLKESLGVSMQTLRDLHTRWRRYRPPVKVVRSLLVAGPVILGGQCFRVIGYETRGGQGLSTEVWHNGRWDSTSVLMDESESPGVHKLRELPQATEQELHDFGVTHWDLPELYNPFSRGKKRRDRRR